MLAKHHLIQRSWIIYWVMLSLFIPRRLCGPQKRLWPWTGTSVRPCCLCSAAALHTSPARSITPRSSTPRSTPSTACPRAARSPKPSGTPSRSAYWPSASAYWTSCSLLWSKAGLGLRTKNHNYIRSLVLIILLTLRVADHTTTITE